MRQRPWLVVGFALLVAVGCGERGRSPSSSGTEVPEVRLSLQHTIDGEQVPAGFGEVVDVEVGEDGSVYVLDLLNRAVQVFDPSGSHVGMWGGRGGGPGELEAPSALSWGPEGRLWVVDPGNLRFTVYERTGELATTYPRPDPAVESPWPGGFSDAGALYDVTYEFGPDGPVGTLIEARVDGGALNAVRRGALPAMEPPAAYELSGAGTMMIVGIPYAPRPVYQVGPDGSLWYGHTGSPWLYRRSLSEDGALIPDRVADSVRVIPSDFERVHVTRADLDDVREREDVQELEQNGGAGALAEFMERIPDRRPAYDDFFFDDVGRLWIVRPGNDERVQLDVYDSTGTRIGRARARIEMDPRARIRGGRLVGVVRDELGAESVSVYRIR